MVGDAGRVACGDVAKAGGDAVRNDRDIDAPRCRRDLGWPISAEEREAGYRSMSLFFPRGKVRLPMLVSRSKCCQIEHVHMPFVCFTRIRVCLLSFLVPIDYVD